MRTQVGIVGAGPAGLMLSHLLHLHGIDSIIVERRSRDHVEKRVRAGVLEQGTVDLMRDTGVGAGLAAEGLVHHGIELMYDGTPHRIPLSDLTGGRAITIYGQQRVVHDLTQARLAAGGRIFFEADEVTPTGHDSGTPAIGFTHRGEQCEISCDFIAGCDGFHGVCRDAVPASERTLYQRDYPFAWLGVLAETPLRTGELVYAHHDNGFALHSMRTPDISRLYVQVGPDEDIASWPDERIWEQLHERLSEARRPATGRVLEKGITTMRSFVCEPLRHGRLFLAGDSAHIVPPTGAKGLNLAMHDVYILAQALDHWYRHGGDKLLDDYSRTCLRRVWRVQHFSWWMTSMLHRFPHADRFDERVRLSQLEYVCSSEPAAASLAENYVGLPW